MLVAALAAAASTSAHADTPIRCLIQLRQCGLRQHGQLGPGLRDAALIRFANPDTVPDHDIYGSETGTFHWVDGSRPTAMCGSRSDGNRGFTGNVLWNDHQPILVSFPPRRPSRCSPSRRTASSFGNPARPTAATWPSSTPRPRDRRGSTFCSSTEILGSDDPEPCYDQQCQWGAHGRRPAATTICQSRWRRARTRCLRADARRPRPVRIHGPSPPFTLKPPPAVL